MTDIPEHPERRETDARASELEGLVADLADEVRKMNVGLDAISDRLDRRPTRVETTYRRRLTVLLIVTLILLVSQATDLHTEACGPGHRSEAIVSSLVHGEIRSIDDFNKVAEHATPGWWCGLTFPTHTHDGRSWPESQHLIGVGLYAALLISLVWWTSVPYRQARSQDD